MRAAPEVWRSSNKGRRGQPDLYTAYTCNPLSISNAYGSERMFLGREDKELDYAQFLMGWSKSGRI